MKRKYLKLVDELIREEDVFFVYLNKGYRIGSSDFSQNGDVVQHCFGEATMKDVYLMLADVVECTCDWCKQDVCKKLYQGEVKSF